MLFADTERTIVPNLDALELIVAKRLEKSLSAGVIDKIKKILKAVKDNIKLTRRIRITIRYKDNNRVLNINLYIKYNQLK